MQWHSCPNPATTQPRHDAAGRDSTGCDAAWVNSRRRLARAHARSALPVCLMLDGLDVGLERVGSVDCLNGRDGELRHFGGRPCSVVRTRLHDGPEQHGDILSFWRSVGDQHWVYDDVWDLEFGSGLDERSNGVEKGNVVDVLKERVVVEKVNVDGNDDESDEGIENVIVVHVEDVEAHPVCGSVASRAFGSSRRS